MTGRLVVTDDGSGVVLEHWQADRCISATSIPPHEAIRLAADLLAIVGPRFGRTVPASLPCPIQGEL